MEIAKIKSLIAAIGRAAAKLVKDIQQAAIEVTLHAIAHGDVTLADSLVDACGSGVRRDSLRAWLEINGPFAVQASGKFGLDKKRAKTMKATAEYRAVLESKLWNEAKREPAAVTVLDIGNKVDKFLEGLNKTANMDGVQVRDRELMDFLITQTKAWHGERAIKAARAMNAAEQRAALGYAPKAETETA